MPEKTTAVVSGIALCLVFEVVIGPLHVADRVLQPGLVAYLAMLLLAFPALWRFEAPGWRSLWLFVCAVAVTDLIPMATRASGMPPALIHSLLGAALGLVVLLALLLFPTRGNQRRPQGLVPGVLAVWIVSLATAGAFQGFNRYQRAAGVANEDRSLLLFDVEVHHLNWGVVLLALLITLGGSRAWSFPAKVAGVVLLGVAIGMITDEWYYYAGRSVTDEAYFEPATWISCAILSLVLLPAWLWSRPAGGPGSDRLVEERPAGRREPHQPTSR